MSNHKDDDDAEVALNPQSTSETAARLPQEILSHIFSEFHWSEYNITPETRYEATFLSISSRDEKRHPESYIGIGGTEHVPWFEYVRNLKSFSSVCSSWRAAVMPMLYQCVYLFQIGQLPALIRTLESSSEKHEEGHKNASSELDPTDHTSEEVTGHGVWIKHIQIAFFVPRVWINLFRMEVLRLLSLCPSLRSIIYRPEWDLEIGAENMPQLLNILRYSMPSRFEQLQELSISNVVLSKEIFGSLQALSNFPKLMKLELELPNLAGYQEFRSARPEGMPKTKIVLPVLETLTLKIMQYNDYLRLEAFGSLFDLPALRHFSIDMLYSTNGNGDNSTFSHLEEFCAAHGSQLLSLCFINHADAFWFTDGLDHVIAKCPKLTHLAYTYESVKRLISTRSNTSNNFVHHSLQHVTLITLPVLNASQIKGELMHHIMAFARKPSFPSLGSIKVHDPRLGGTNPFITKEQIVFFENHLPVGIRVVGYNNQPLDTWIQNREYRNVAAEEDDGCSAFIYMRNDESLNLLLEREKLRAEYSDDEEGWSVENPDPESIELDMEDERKPDSDNDYLIDIFPLPSDEVARQSAELLGIFERVLFEDEYTHFDEDEEMLEEKMLEEDEQMLEDEQMPEQDEQMLEEDADDEDEDDVDVDLMMFGIDEDEGQVIYHDEQII